MRGMNRETGKPLEGIDHLRQRIVDVITTPVGSRVGNRGYGSTLFLLGDKNMNQNWFVQLYAIINEAVINPVNGVGDFRPTKFSIREYTESGVSVDMHGVYLPTRENIVLEAVQIAL